MACAASSNATIGLYRNSVLSIGWLCVKGQSADWWGLLTHNLIRPLSPIRTCLRGYTPACLYMCVVGVLALRGAYHIFPPTSPADFWVLRCGKLGRGFPVERTQDERSFLHSNFQSSAPPSSAAFGYIQARRQERSFNHSPPQGQGPPPRSQQPPSGHR